MQCRLHLMLIYDVDCRCVKLLIQVDNIFKVIIKNSITFFFFEKKKYILRKADKIVSLGC